MIDIIKSKLYQFSMGLSLSFYLIFLAVSTVLCSYYGAEGLVLFGLLFEDEKYSFQFFAILFVFGIIVAFIDSQILAKWEKRIWQFFVMTTFLCIFIMFISEILHHYNIITTRFRII